MGSNRPESEDGRCCGPGPRPAEPFRSWDMPGTNGSAGSFHLPFRVVGRMGD
jgi:hypothetical protein